MIPPDTGGDVRTTGVVHEPPAIGLAYSNATPAFVQKHHDAIDYIEVPFELLCHDPSVISIEDFKPVLLHCASLSIAGSVFPTTNTLESIRTWIQRTQTPWLGEHLSFITAIRGQMDGPADEYAPGEPYNIGYTVCPAFNAESVKQVCLMIEFCQAQIQVPILLENSPVYFRTPGSTMSQVEFISEICARSTANLLLDLAHFYITSCTQDFDPYEQLMALPLERVVEVHLSGVDVQAGGHWDNHAGRTPDIEFSLLSLALTRSLARAVTLEYNWSSAFPTGVLLDEIDRTRAVIATSSRPVNTR
jgi:uncharacterized protein (UPF0276 family)